MPTTTDRCPHCGRALEPLFVDVLGKTYRVGSRDCTCEGAEADRAELLRRQAEAERREREQARIDALLKSGIMPRFIAAEHPLAAECAGEVAGGGNLYIFGGVGTLKTSLASAVARRLVEDGWEVVFSAMWRILDEIKDGFRDGRDPLPSYQCCDVLILDDLGKESPTDFALERLFALVDERSALMRPTVVTTQYRPGKLIDRLAKNGDRDTAVAIVSRLRQDCRTVEMGGGDRRLA